MVPNLNVQIIDLLKEIYNEECQSSPRGLKCYEKFNHTFVVDSTRPIISFPKRKFNWKYFLGELTFYLKKDLNINWINNFSTFWQKIANNNFINSNYGSRLFGKNSNQIFWIVNELKKDPFSRRAIGFISGPENQYELNKDFICTNYILFWIRNNKLYLKVQMRSNDIFYGTTYDIPFFAILHQAVRLLLLDKYPNLALGEYYHSADNIHFYDKHKELVENILQENDYEDNFICLKTKMLEMYENYIDTSSQFEILIYETQELLNNKDMINIENSKELLKKYFWIE